MSAFRPFLGIDIDGVVANLHEPWIDWLRAFDFDIEHRPGFTHWSHPLDLAGKFALEFLHPRIYDKDIVKPYAGAVAAITLFRDLGYGITFVSDCINDTREAKLRWLRRNGFWNTDTRFLSMADKSDAPVYMLVDDHIVNVQSFRGPAVLVTRSHNRDETWCGPRINHLVELYPLIR